MQFHFTLCSHFEAHCCLLIAYCPSNMLCCSWMDLLRQLCMLPHQDRSCGSNLLSHLEFSRLNSHIHLKLKLASSSRRLNHRACSTKMPPLQSYKRRCVACEHSPVDQTLWLQAGAGEGDFIYPPSSPDHVACERQEEQEDIVKVY